MRRTQFSGTFSVLLGPQSYASLCIVEQLLRPRAKSGLTSARMHSNPSQICDNLEVLGSHDGIHALPSLGPLGVCKGMLRSQQRMVTTQLLSRAVAVSHPKRCPVIPLAA